MADPGVKPTIRRRRIIARPRLIAALERSRARVRMLVASAGYGKTILAEQWAAQDGVRVAWVRARRSSADVAVLARELAAAAAEIVPGCDRRLCERLSATTDPAGEVSVLAEMLAEDLMEWPEDAWIAIDDYHHLCAASAPEVFVETIVQRTPVRLLISTRQRPSWVSTRGILYGDVLEVGQTALAMRQEEADEVLAGARDAMSPGLLALAEGWPAVIGLAGLTSSPVGPDVEMPEELYEFFAEEVYRSLEPEVRSGLGLLAVAPLLDRDLAAALLGADQGARVCREALALGIIDERGGRLELHPLAGAFLKTRSRREVEADLQRAVEILLGEYRRRREWDAAFDLVERQGREEHLDGLLADALDEVLNTGRLATVENWVVRAESRRLTTPSVQRAKAELALRRGGHMTAQTLAETALSRVAEVDDEESFRLHMLAARAAHAGSREEAALRHYERAESVTTDSGSKRAAVLGQLMCASALELDSARALLEQLETSSRRLASDPLELVRMADKRLGLGFRFGFIRHLGEARLAAELVPHVGDPFARCSFRCALACALNLSSYYQEAATHADAALAEARDLRIDPVLPYGHTMLAVALAGQRHYSQAHQELDLAAIESRRCVDLFGEQMVYASRVRLLLQEGRAADACAIEPPELGGSLPAMRGEVLASRGLILASLGRFDEARALGAEASSSTRGIEATVLSSAIEAVSRVNGRDARVLDAVESLTELAFETGAVDILVTTYRANPDLLGLLLSSSSREQTVYLVARAGDEDLVATVVGAGGSTLDPLKSLSKREHEVYALACQGLSNAAIAKQLFISQATVKVHMHHVFDKLGVRSRTALALNAARDRLRQAAPAMGVSVEDSVRERSSSSEVGE